MSPVVLFIPLLFAPFLYAFVVRKAKGKKRWTYLLMALSVPAWPLILTLNHILPHEGFVLVGTSVLGIPFAVMMQYLVNKVFFR